MLPAVTRVNTFWACSNSHLSNLTFPSQQYSLNSSLVLWPTSNSGLPQLRPCFSLEEQLFFFRLHLTHITFSSVGLLIAQERMQEFCFAAVTFKASLFYHCLAYHHLSLKPDADGKVLVWHHLQRNICTMSFSSDLSVIRSLSLQTAGNQNTQENLLSCSWQHDNMTIFQSPFQQSPII